MTTMFWVIAIVASAFLTIQILLLIFGVDMEFDSDMDVDASDGGGFMSIRSLTAFFGGFGWAGVAARQAGWSGVPSLLVGIAVGLGMFIVVGFLFVQARRLTSSGNLNYSSTVGSTGIVYLTVPPLRSGSGKVELNVSGRISVVSAVSDAEQPIPAKTRVRVTELIDQSTVRVEPA